MKVITNVQGNPNAYYIETDSGDLIETTKETMFTDMAKIGEGDDAN